MAARPAEPTRRYLRLLGEIVFAAAALESEVERQLTKLGAEVPTDSNAGPDGWRSLDQLAMTLRRDSHRVKRKAVAEYMAYCADVLVEASEIIDTVTRGTPTVVDGRLVLLRLKHSGGQTPATEKWVRAQAEHIEDLQRGLAKVRSRL